ncbi:MAG: hypothetical protein LUE86_04005, partial [Clostridiales bacterium]|nr:hypothetical protein [Clostridiales bacterium]
MNGDRENRKNRWPVIFGVILTVYAAFTLLDAFVFPRDVVSVNELAQGEEAREGGAAQEEASAEVDAVSESAE